MFALTILFVILNVIVASKSKNYNLQSTEDDFNDMITPENNFADETASLEYTTFRTSWNKNNKTFLEISEIKPRRIIKRSTKEIESDSPKPTRRIKHREHLGEVNKITNNLDFQPENFESNDNNVVKKTNDLLEEQDFDSTKPIRRIRHRGSASKQVNEGTHELDPHDDNSFELLKNQSNIHSFHERSGNNKIEALKNGEIESPKPLRRIRHRGSSFVPSNKTNNQFQTISRPIIEKNGNVKSMGIIEMPLQYVSVVTDPKNINSLSQINNEHTLLDVKSEEHAQDPTHSNMKPSEKNVKMYQNVLGAKQSLGYPKNYKEDLNEQVNVNQWINQSPFKFPTRSNPNIVNKLPNFPNNDHRPNENMVQYDVTLINHDDEDKADHYVENPNQSNTHLKTNKNVFQNLLKARPRYSYQELTEENSGGLTTEHLHEGNTKKPLVEHQRNRHKIIDHRPVELNAKVNIDKLESPNRKLLRAKEKFNREQIIDENIPEITQEPIETDKNKLFGDRHKNFEINNLNNLRGRPNIYDHLAIENTSSQVGFAERSDQAKTKPLELDEDTYQKLVEAIQGKEKFNANSVPEQIAVDLKQLLRDHQEANHSIIKTFQISNPIIIFQKLPHDNEHIIKDDNKVKTKENPDDFTYYLNNKPLENDKKSKTVKTIQRYEHQEPTEEMSTEIVTEQYKIDPLESTNKKTPISKPDAKRKAGQQESKDVDDLETSYEYEEHLDKPTTPVVNVKRIFKTKVKRVKPTIMRKSSTENVRRRKEDTNEPKTEPAKIRNSKRNQRLPKATRQSGQEDETDNVDEEQYASEYSQPNVNMGDDNYHNVLPSNSYVQNNLDPNNELQGVIYVPNPIHYIPGIISGTIPAINPGIIQQRIILPRIRCVSVPVCQQFLPPLLCRRVKTSCGIV